MATLGEITHYWISSSTCALPEHDRRARLEQLRRYPASLSVVGGGARLPQRDTDAAGAPCVGLGIHRARVGAALRGTPTTLPRTTRAGDAEGCLLRVWCVQVCGPEAIGHWRKGARETLCPLCWKACQAKILDVMCLLSGGAGLRAHEMLDTIGELAQSGGAMP